MSEEDKQDFNEIKDYTYSRDTYYDLIEKGRESLELMMAVARESEHPRAFEVLSGMMKNIADINGELMNLNKKKKEIKQIGKSKNPEGLTQNNLFVGSTAELQKMLMQKEEKVIEADSDKEE